MSQYIFTLFPSTSWWKNLQNSATPDAQKSFGNCSALYFSLKVSFANCAGFSGGCISGLALFRRVVERSWKNTWAIPTISKPRECSPPDKYEFFSRKQNFSQILVNSEIFCVRQQIYFSSSIPQICPMVPWIYDSPKLWGPGLFVARCHKAI